LHLTAPNSIISQLVVTTLGFTVAYLVLALLPGVRKELVGFKDVLGALWSPSEQI